MKNNKRNAGFTLIEWVVTLAVTGIFLGAVFQIFIAQQQIAQDQGRIQEAQQGIRITMDLLNSEFRSGQIDQMDLHVDGVTTERIKGVLVHPSTQTGHTDTLFVFKVVHDDDYEAISRRSLLQSPGDTIVIVHAFGDTMETAEDVIRVADAQPLLDYAMTQGLTISAGTPLMASVLGPDLERYEWVNPWVYGGPNVRDVGGFVTTIPEIVFITGINEDVSDGQSGSYDELEVNTVGQRRWNRTEEGLVRRYGYFGYPPTTTAPREPGVVPLPGTSDITIRPIQWFAIFAVYDEAVQRYRLVRLLPNGTQEIIADDVDNFDIFPDESGEDFYRITLSAKVLRYGRSHTSTNPADFIRKTDSLFVYP